MRQCPKALTPTRCTGAAGGALTSMRVFQVGHWEICDVFEDAILFPMATFTGHCRFSGIWSTKGCLNCGYYLETISSTIKQTPTMRYTGMIAISGATVPLYQCESSTCQANHDQSMTREDRISQPPSQLIHRTASEEFFHQYPLPYPQKDHGSLTVKHQILWCRYCDQFFSWPVRQTHRICINILEICQICFVTGDANQFASHHFHKSIFFKYLIFGVLDLHTHSSIWKGSSYAVSCPSTGGATPTVGAASWGDVVGDPLSNAKANPTAPVAMRMALAARLNSKPETRIKKKSRGHFVDF